MVTDTEYMVKKCRMDTMLKIKTKRLFQIFIVALIVASCSTTKKVAISPRAQADILYNKAEYANALIAYQALDSASRDSAVYHNMALSAFMVQNFTIAVEVTRNITPDSILKVKFNNFIDSLNTYSSQITVVENNTDFFQQIVGQKVYDKLVLYYDSREDSKLVDVYSKASAQVRSECFPKYFSFVRNEKSNTELIQVCKNALADNKNQIVALKYLGVQNYNVAEADYKKAMDEYNRKKNNTTYAYLRRDLKRISAVYVKSREYLDKVHKLDPEDMQTIKYLININNRLDQPAKAKALQRLLK